MTDWPGPAAGGAEAWVHVDTQVLGAPAATVNFAGIAAGVAPRLRMYAYIIQDGTGGTPRVRLNNDAAANYVREIIHANAGAAAAVGAAAQNQMSANFGPLANEHALWLLDIIKPVAGEVAHTTGRLAVRDTPIFELHAFEWTNTGALINRVELQTTAGNYDTGTRVVLEGAA